MKPIKTPTFILPRLLRLGVLLFLVVGGIGYGGWQARYLIIGPAITISEPPSIVQNDRTVTITGTAENATRLYLNGRPIITDASGHFFESVVLENGPSSVSLVAFDRYGRLDRWEQPLVFVEETGLAGRTNEEVAAGL